jgi:hypothetical protein
MNLYVATGGWHKIWVIIAESEAQCMQMIVQRRAGRREPSDDDLYDAEEDMETLEVFPLAGECAPRIVLDAYESL